MAFAEDRYERMTYRRCGCSGLMLPAVSLGCWHNFGDGDDLDEARRMLHRAFDLGITHFDLANNYGPPGGSAERNVGRFLREDFASHRDELIISTKAGFYMWPGPYGDHGSKKYLVSSLDQSLQRLGLDYVDIFYHHRPDPATPLEETIGTLQLLVQQGKCLYAGISNYRSAATVEAERIIERQHGHITIHQPNYSMLSRWIEGDLLPHTGRLGIGVIVFSPLAQGMLSDKYLDGIPEDSRAAKPTGFLRSDQITEGVMVKVRALNEIAKARGQSLAQMALAWCLRDERVTSVLVGASRVTQIEENVAALDCLSFADDELQAIEAALSL